MPATFPLINRNLDDNFALVDDSLRPRFGVSGSISTREFMSHVLSLADRLPEATHAINICDNRYIFSVAFFAVILKRQTNLLPQNKAKDTIARLQKNYDSTYILHDGVFEDGNHSRIYKISELDNKDRHHTTIPQINLDHIAAVAFTSGSTGEPKANIKTWETLYESSKINALEMLGNEQQNLTSVATVPPQHMWGLETSILLPAFSRACLSDRRPFFPEDLRRVLEKTPEPRLLITTPVHLRALTRSNLSFPNIERILCATAPLSRELAVQTENLFSGTLTEVFGCSEIGSMARRNTATEEQWHKFGGISLEESDGHTTAFTSYLTEKIELQDILKFHDSEQFSILGRREDLIELAGKRGSLLELNTILMEIPSIIDGAIFIPDEESGINRPAAFVVSESNSVSEDIRRSFSKKVDPIFTPRPIIRIEKLPREQNGKIKKKELAKLYKERFSD